MGSPIEDAVALLREEMQLRISTPGGQKYWMTLRRQIIHGTLTLDKASTWLAWLRATQPLRPPRPLRLHRLPGRDDAEIETDEEDLAEDEEWSEEDEGSGDEGWGRDDEGDSERSSPFDGHDHDGGGSLVCEICGESIEDVEEGLD